MRVFATRFVFFGIIMGFIDIVSPARRFYFSPLFLDAPMLSNSEKEVSEDLAAALNSLELLQSSILLFFEALDLV